MELIILRHGKAEDFHSSGDAGRQLLEKGRIQSRDAGRLLKDSGILPELVLCSPLTRARQTADEFCTAAGLPAPTVVSWLAAGMHPDTALNELTAYREFGRVAIVGHEPDLSELIQWVLGARGNSVEMKKGSLACLRIHPPAKLGTLLFLAPPAIVGDL
jgi:phosphohistidine phosphatase